MSNVSYVPEQDRPENQDPSVAYVVDHMTGGKTQLEGAPAMQVVEPDVDVPVFTEQEAEAKKEAQDEQRAVAEGKKDEPKRKEPTDAGNVARPSGARK